MKRIKKYFLTLRRVKTDESDLRLLYIILYKPESKKDYKKLNRVKERLHKKIRNVVFFRTKINTLLAVGRDEEINYVKSIFTAIGIKVSDEIDRYVMPLFPEDSRYLFERNHNLIERPYIDEGKPYFLI